MKRIIGNRRDQKIVGLLYLALAIGLRVRAEAGAIIPYIESTTGLTSDLISMLFVWCSGYLLRTSNIQLRWYGVVLFPLLVSCIYLMFYMVTTPTTSLLTGILSLGLAVLLVSNLQQQVKGSAQ